MNKLLATVRTEENLQCKDTIEIIVTHTNKMVYLKEVTNVCSIIKSMEM